MELARTAIKSGARMSISIARETLQTTQVWKGEVHIHVQFSPSTLCLRCGVPYSCCREDTDEINTNLVNLMCGFGVQYPPGASRWYPARSTSGSAGLLLALNFRILQEEAEAEAVLKINTQGCIPRIQTLIENNLYPVVGVAIGVAVSQVLISAIFSSF